MLNLKSLYKIQSLNCGLHKTKNKYFLTSREEPGHSHDLSKAKPNSNSVNNSVSRIYDLLTIFRAPPKVLRSLL